MKKDAYKTRLQNRVKELEKVIREYRAALLVDCDDVPKDKGVRIIDIEKATENLCASVRIKR